MRPPNPHALSLAVMPNTFGKNSEPWPAGITSPATLMMFR